MKKALIILIFFFIFSCEVFSLSCEVDEMNNLKELAKSVDVVYELNEPFNNVYNDVVNDSYNIYINELSSEFYYKFVDLNYDIVNFENKNIIDGEVEIIRSWLAGNYRIDIYSKKCGILLNKINVSLPKYNMYHDYSICDDYIDKIEVCDKWYDGIVNDEIIKKEIEKYNFNNRSFFEKYYIYFSLAILIVILSVIFILLKKRCEE